MFVVVVVGFMWVSSRFPFKLVTLLDTDDPAGVATRLLAEPPCLRDRFTKALFTQYPSAQELASHRCRCIILAMCLLLKNDIVLNEYRHASVRRIVAFSSATNACQMDAASAAWFLLRQRLLEASTVGRHRLRLQKVRKRLKGGGGGSCRAFQSKYLKGKRFADKDARKVVFREAAVAYARFLRRGSEAEIRENRERGRLGTLAHRRGGHAFGNAVVGRRVVAALGPAPAPDGQLVAQKRQLFDDLTVRLGRLRSTSRQLATQRAAADTARQEAIVKWSLETGAQKQAILRNAGLPAVDAAVGTQTLFTHKNLPFDFVDA